MGMLRKSIVQSFWEGFLMEFTSAVSKIQYRIGGVLRKMAPALLALAGWCALLITASHGRLAYAQNTNATIRGQVFDPAGALSVTEVGSTATFATSSGFGKITGTQPNRQMQASARFFF